MIVGAAVAVKLAGPVAPAETDPRHLVLIMAGVIVGAGAGPWHSEDSQAYLAQVEQGKAKAAPAPYARV